ncbi:MAG: isoleucine--tRNA ligase [Candidatus Micrarchaeota archaeon]|nr:isoleucine--tRNA ligase [Candidatus Micrarchaeota archaeon]
MYEAGKTEKRIAAFWEKEKIYERIKERNAKGEFFYFCDGPPYATGQIHPGTAWNKCIKDAVCRYKRARGLNVRAKPGYDTHGLPIEVKVEQELKLKSKKDIEKVGVPEFIRKCKEFASKYIGVMGAQFASLGVWMDWNDPYITYKDSYIEKSWATIKKAHEKGLLQRGIYVLPQCPRCETTIANYELEYDDREDYSIYVKFKIKGKENENEYLIIWTTTPWTLVANMAVMVHPTYKYVKVKVGEEVWIVAKERLEEVLKAAGGASATVLEEMPGRKLSGIEYHAPLEGKVPKEYARKVVLNDMFVTLEEGTGLVHTAPGHGPQDFAVGKQYGIEAFCPVDERGNYTSEAGEYAGMNVKDANKPIVDYLAEVGTLIHEGRIKHRYPHCWRCKTPLIFITTDQWFINITKNKERMFQEMDKVTWQPAFAGGWLRDFVGAAPDWCISRQRYWGIPLPIWECGKCKEMKVIGSRAELGREVQELHKPFVDEVEFDCKCGGKMRRVSDVLDVWFDSGNAVWASLAEGENYTQADFIVEGKDQIRGWFYSLLGSGIVMNDQIPYKSLLMHGHFVDEKGEKMSKSLGNFVPLEEISKKHGADAFRLWSLSNTVWDDLKFNWNELGEAERTLSILWNISVFVERFEIKEEEKASLENEDAWLISRANSLVKEVTEDYESYRIHDGVRACKEFVVEDLSRFYLKLAKRRQGGKSWQGAQRAIYHALLTSIRLLSPAIPFICEEIYGRLYAKDMKGGEASISMLAWPQPNAKEIDVLLEKQMGICKNAGSAASNARQKANVKLRWPLEEAIVQTESTEVKQAVEKLSGVIAAIANVKAVRLGADPGESSGYEKSEFEGGVVFVKTKMSEALYDEAMVSEVRRRIQMARKELGLVETDHINVSIAASGTIGEAVTRNKKQLADSVKAKELVVKDSGKGKEWEIEGEKVKINVEKA